MPQGPKIIPFPTKEDIVEFLRSTQQKANKREIARAFHVRGDDRVRLKQLLKEMAEDGLIEHDMRKALKPKGGLPNVCVVEIIGLDKFGDLMAKPVDWASDEEEKPPRIFMVASKRVGGSLAKGDRVLSRLTPAKDQDGPYFSARILKILDTAPNTILGVYKASTKGKKEPGRLLPVSKKERFEYLVAEADKGSAQDGSLVKALVLGKRKGQVYGLHFARVVENLNDLASPKSISLIALYQNDIPIDFSPETLLAAQRAKAITSKDLKTNDVRQNLTQMPFITIDPHDARDHDDAIMALADKDPKNKGGWVISIAIADVSHYVTIGSALDKDARLRGNSVYLPDRVVPMLPEELSADLCSLMPNVERPAMVVHIWIDENGQKLRHKFERAIIKSIANVHYQEVQAAMDGDMNENTKPLLESTLKPLYGAFKALDKERTARQPLDLELPERKVILDDNGEVEEIIKRERLDSHRLVEEFMIAANVAAAESLEQKSTQCMYRVHDEPSFEKIEGLREFLSTLDINFARGQVLQPKIFNTILKKVDDKPYKELVNQVVLRSQTQAYYSPENHGHFGLALPRYAHFTSPIRRYSDLLVHRGLIKAFKLGDDGLTKEEADTMVEIGEAISITERRAMIAERETTDRYLAQYMASHTGQILFGRISGVTRFGLFITIEPSGADGLIPISSIGSDYFDHDEAHHKLVGRKSGKSYSLGDQIAARLIEADPLSGSMRFELVDENGNSTAPQGSKYKSKSKNKDNNRQFKRKKTR